MLRARFREPIRQACGRWLRLPTLIAAFLCVASCRADGQKHLSGGLDVALVPFGLCMAGANPASQVSIASRAGYHGLGIATMNPGTLRSFARLPEVRSGEFRIPSTLWWSEVGDPLDTSRLDSVLASAHEMDMSIWMVAAGSKKAPGALEQAIEKYDRVARRCETAGVRLVLYPHAGTVIETVEESLPILDSLRRRGHPEVMTSIHLCHELKAGNGGRLDGIVKKSAPHLALASISGADSDPITIRLGGWESVIKPLDEGTFDPRPFLASLARYGFRGTMELHTYHLKDPGKPGYDQHLERSLRRWRELVADSGSNRAR